MRSNPKDDAFPGTDDGRCVAEVDAYIKGENVKMRKIIPPGIGLLSAIRLGYIGRIEDRAYLDWVKTQPCCVCQAPADDPHHIVGHGCEGQGTKTPDYWTIPLCRSHHDILHRNWREWEEAYGSQMLHVCSTLTMALVSGVIVLKGRS